MLKKTLAMMELTDIQKFTENYLNKISIKKLKSVSCRIFSIYGKNTNTIINVWKKKF